MSYLLSFEIKTKGDFETEKDKYIDYNKTIYFIPTIKLTKELVTSFVEQDQDLKISKDYQKIFTSMNKFINFVNYASDIKNNKGYKKITLKEAKDQGIIKSNIEFIKNIFFYPKGNYYIYGRKYIIYSSTLLLDSLREIKNTGTSVTTSFATPSVSGTSRQTTYKIAVELVLLDASKQDLEGDFRKLSCNEKAKMLDKEALELFDFSLNLAKDEPVKFVKSSRTTPALYSSKYTRLGPYDKMLYQKEVEKRKAEDIKKLQALVRSSGWEEEKKKRELEKERAKVLADLKEAEKWLEEKKKRELLGGSIVRSKTKKHKTKTSKKTNKRKSAYGKLKKRH